MTALILAGAFCAGRLGAAVTASPDRTSAVSAEAEDTKSLRGAVVVDAGHGGVDAGKVGVNGALEREVNLQIARKLKACLEQEGFSVTLTREGDGGLYDEGEANKKQQDMKRRCEKINSSGALLAVSIHQNSYTDASVCGPQVFYYATSAQGQALARALQDSLNRGLEVQSPREIRANDTYYILKKTVIPTVIAECGFLSNPAEAEKLTDAAYQEEVVQALCAGIIDYLDGERE